MKSETKIVPATDGRPITVLKPDVRYDFGPKDPLMAVKELIYKHVGIANAISIEGIAEKLWDNRWWMPGMDDHNMANYPHRAQIQRQVKDLVSRLKRKDKRIGACRASKDGVPGYYLISNDSELVDSVMPYFSQAVTMLATVEQMTGVDMLVPELRQKAAVLKALKIEPQSTQV